MITNDKIVENIKATMAAEGLFLQEKDVSLINQYLNNEIIGFTDCENNEETSIGTAIGMTSGQAVGGTIGAGILGAAYGSGVLCDYIFEKKLGW